MGFEIVAAAQRGQSGDRQLLTVHLANAALLQVPQGAMKVFLQNKSHHQPAARMQLRQRPVDQRRQVAAAAAHKDRVGFVGDRQRRNARHDSDIVAAKALPVVRQQAQRDG